MHLKENGKHYDFIEVMACPGGCIGGGGQPRTKLPQAVKTKEARIGGLYEADENYNGLRPMKILKFKRCTKTSWVNHWAIRHTNFYTHITQTVARFLVLVKT